MSSFCGELTDIGVAEGAVAEPTGQIVAKVLLINTFHDLAIRQLSVADLVGFDQVAGDSLTTCAAPRTSPGLLCGPDLALGKHPIKNECMCLKLIKC